MLAGGWALGAGACAVVDTLLAAMLVEGMAANGWALDAGAWAGSGTLLLASMVAANGWALGTGAWASAGVLLLADGWAGASAGRTLLDKANTLWSLPSLPYTHL